MTSEIFFLLSLQPDTLSFPRDTLFSLVSSGTLQHTWEVSIPPLPWRSWVDSLIRPPKVPFLADTAGPENLLVPSLLQPLYRDPSGFFARPLPRHDVSQSWFFLTGILLVVGILRISNPARFSAFLRSYFSDKPLEDLMRDRLIFPGLLPLFIGASYTVAFCVSEMFPNHPMFEGFLMPFWVPAGAGIFLFMVLKHAASRLWGSLMGHERLSLCHVHFSSQALVLGATFCLGGLAGSMASLWPVQVNPWFLMGATAVTPLWALSRTILSTISQARVNIFYNIYYLCTLEILPVVGVIHILQGTPKF
ncbi:MAG: DUF4271 domain-containing protein [Flavobacteriales bacterium]|nr:DUF4271 domain-containing protein [Flavobacteriales bacterium]